MAPREYIGLNNDEVKSNYRKFGGNSFEEKKQNTLWKTIREIITEPLFVILVFVALIYFLLRDFNEGIIMLTALCIVSGISLYQGNRSKNAVEALKKLSNPLAKVIRNGETTEIPAEEIVMNDTIVVEDGNIVPADAIILKMNDFSVNESVLTGESLEVVKELQEPNNKIFQGTMVTSGSCIAKVNAIGKNTALGKIGQSLQQIQISKTPLQLQIKNFIRSMVIAGTIIFFIVWGINYYLSKSLLHGLLHGLTLAMSILPEEIPVAFSTFMALGAYHLYKKKVIAKSPYTVETLGAATVICADKTGTITENAMELSSIYDFSNGRIYDYRKEPFNFNPVLEYALWASETEPFDNMEKSIHKVYGAVARPDRRGEYSMVHEYPLSGKPPIMTHVFKNQGGEYIIACKGSVEGVLKQSQLSPEQKISVQDQAGQFASKGFRVLAVARSVRGVNNLPVSQQEFEFEFIGLIAFYDPPKKSIQKTLQQFYDAGINVKMITGDAPETAIAISNQINLKNSSKVITGKEVTELDPIELREKIKNVNVFARMFPDAKLKVIEALKANGEVVAMTGDGVNDGPALKAAHIGIAMGKHGSEIAKNASSLILMEDDLSRMVDAVALGRRIYENLKKAIRYIISIHIPIILIVTAPLLLFWKYTDFFSPVHVIFLELIMGPTCSIIFESEPIEADSMHKKPRKLTSTFFSFSELSVSIVQGLIITIGCLALGYYFMEKGASQALVRTIIYTTLIFSNVFLTLANRSFYYSIFKTIKYRNKLIPVILTASLLVLFSSLYIGPVKNIFHFESLRPDEILLCFVVSFLCVMWIEVYKKIKRNHAKTSQTNTIF